MKAMLRPASACTTLGSDRQGGAVERSWICTENAQTGPKASSSEPAHRQVFLAGHLHSAPVHAQSPSLVSSNSTRSTELLSLDPFMHRLGISASLASRYTLKVHS